MSGAPAPFPPDRREELTRRRALRAGYLEALYWKVDGSVSAFEDGFALGRELDLSRDETLGIMEYLEEKGLVRVDDHKEGTLRLTALGVDRVEESET